MTIVVDPATAGTAVVVSAVVNDSRVKSCSPGRQKGVTPGANISLLLRKLP